MPWLQREAAIRAPLAALWVELRPRRVRVRLGLEHPFATDGHLANLALLNLHDNKLSDAGAQALAAALSAGQLPKLGYLQVNGNAIGDAGAEALAAAVRGGGGASLATLVVGENAFGDASTEALRTACAARGVAAQRDMFNVL